MAKLLYIASLPHSGSTLLDLLLGSHEETVSMGEVHYLNWQLMNRHSEDEQSYCSCGEKFDTCSFWRPILDDLSVYCGKDLIQFPKALNFAINMNRKRYGFQLQHRLNNRLAYLLTAYHIASLRRMVSAFYQSSVRDYWKLLEYVGNRTRASYLIDSSKNLQRYFYIRTSGERQTKMIYLYRDVEGYATSSHHGLNDRMISARLKKWEIFHLKVLPAYLKDLSPMEYRIVSYEKLCREPEKVLGSLFEFLHLTPPEPGRICQIEPWKHHTIQGNPIRLKKESINVRYDDRWRGRLPVKFQLKAEEIKKKVNDKICEFNYEE